MTITPEEKKQAIEDARRLLACDGPHLRAWMLGDRESLIAAVHRAAALALEAADSPTSGEERGAAGSAPIPTPPVGAEPEKEQEVAPQLRKSRGRHFAALGERDE